MNHAGRWLADLVAFLLCLTLLFLTGCSDVANDEIGDAGGPAATEDTGSSDGGADDGSGENGVPSDGSGEKQTELEPMDPFGGAGLEVTAADGSTSCSCVLVADTPQLRSRGLMGVTDLKGWDGMIFTWPDDVTSRFTMRDTPMPLSIAWISADGSVVSTSDMDPCLDPDDCPSYSASGPYRLALEVPRGDLERLDVTAATTVRVVESCV